MADAAVAFSLGPGGPGLYKRLLWLTFFRIVTISVLLGGAVAVGLRNEDSVEALLPLYGVVVAAYASALATSVLLRQKKSIVVTAYVHVVLEVLVSAAIVALTGRTESVFVFLYSLAIVNGAILLFRRGAILAVSLAIPAHLVVSSRLFGPVATTNFTLFTQSAAFIATAALASYLSEQLRHTGETLAARESDLAEMKVLHETIVQSMTGGLLTLDPDGRITFLNRPGEQMCGTSLPRALGRLASELFPAFRAGAGRDEVDFVNQNGARLRLGYSSFPLLGERGVVLGTAVSFQDLTRLREMEEAVQRGERLADLGRLAAGLAHELRNPLASMSGSLELLRAQSNATDDDRRLMDIALREAERLDELVSDFLFFARPPPPRRTTADVSVVLGDMLEVFANDPAAKGVNLYRDLSPAPADCDADQIRQLGWNLVLNAAQAVQGLGCKEGGSIRVACRAEGAEVRIDVEDDGPGVSAADRERIFIPFFTTKERGTGLGLATVHRVVEAHGGAVTFATAPGKGTRFTVVFPAHARPA